jgi:ATP-dependent Clp protease protease subunit
MRNERRLLQLLRDNHDERRELVVKVKAETDEASIYLYDVIDPWWGVAAKDFVQALNAITASKIHLHINSPGGDVFEARAMAAAIAAHKSTIVAHVDGLAASAATYVAIAAKEVEMVEGSFFMIHKAWSIALGNADDMLQMAAILEKVDGSIVADYMKKTGKTKEELVALMAAETWYTAEEAKAAGFADRIAGELEEEEEQAASARWNLAAYAKVPAALLEARKPKPSPAAEPQYDRAALERRLAMYEKSRIAA